MRRFANVVVNDGSVCVFVCVRVDTILVDAVSQHFFIRLSDHDKKLMLDVSKAYSKSRKDNEDSVRWQWVTCGPTLIKRHYLLCCSSSSNSSSNRRCRHRPSPAMSRHRDLVSTVCGVCVCVH